MTLVWVALGVLGAMDVVMAVVIRRLYSQVHGIQRRTWRVSGPIG